MSSTTSSLEWARQMSAHIEQLNEANKYLANRAEELSSLLAGMTTERDGLREVLRRMCDKFYPHACNVNGPERTCDRCSTLRQASAALNHAEQGEGSDAG